MVSDCDSMVAGLDDSLPHRYRVRDFVVDLLAERLLGPEGREVPLSPRSFAVLRHLLARHGRLISHEELMLSVWGDVVVTDDSLVQAICDVRRALGDDKHELILTMRGRGYRIPSRMVVEERDDGFAGSGFARDLLAAFGHSSELHVVAPEQGDDFVHDTAADFELARQIGARYVIYGRVGTGEKLSGKPLHVSNAMAAEPLISTRTHRDLP